MDALINPITVLVFLGLLWISFRYFFSAEARDRRRRRRNHGRVVGTAKRPMVTFTVKTK